MASKDKISRKMWWRIKSHHIFGVCIFLLAFLWPYRSYAFAPFLLVFRHVFSYHTKLWATLLGAVWRLLKFLLLPVVSLLWDSMPENAMGCILLIVVMLGIFGPGSAMRSAAVCAVFIATSSLPIHRSQANPNPNPSPNPNPNPAHRPSGSLAAFAQTPMRCLRASPKLATPLTSAGPDI